jgi:hypothetical protein
MRPKLQKHRALKLAGRMNEIQILQTQCRNICKLNSSRTAEGMNPTACCGIHTRDLLVIIHAPNISNTGTGRRL